MFVRMKLLIIFGCVAFGSSSDVPKNDTSEAKTKRGIYHLSDPNYSLLPVHHLERYTQERSLTDDASQISITYRPLEDIKPQQDVFHHQQQQQPYDYGDAAKVSSNNHYKINDASHLTHFPNYAASHYSNPIAQQTARAQEHLAVPPQHLIAPQYPYLNHKISNPLSFYGTDKHITLPTNIRTTSEIKIPDYLESYTTIPIIYGQPNGGHLPSLKYIQPLQKAQYNLPTSYNTYNSLPITNTYQPYKTLTAKLQVAAPHQHIRPLNNFKPLQSNYFQPQVFDNPIVPQIQHYIPPVQSPFDAFTKQAPVPIQAKPTPPPPKKEQSSDEEDDDEDSDDEEDHKEVRGGAIRHEINDEDEFDRGYDDASRGFPTYDDDDDHRRPRYRDDEDNYERFRSRYQAERDEDDDHKGHYSTKRERSRKLRDYDDDKKGRYSDRDREESHKVSKKEPKDKYNKSKSSYEASKYYKGDDNGRKKSYSKHYKSKKPQVDSRYVGSSLKKQTSKKPSNAKESASSRSTIELQYGFEPIKVATEEVDSVAKHSEPNHNRKLYKENWFYSKSSKTQ